MIGGGAVAFIDQLTKWVVHRSLPLNGTIRLFDGDLVQLRHVRNPGSAFGFDFLSPLVLLIFALAAASGVGAYILFHPQLRRSQGVALSLILGGALGNLTDRIIYNEVVDFISVDFPDLIMPRWPTFNLADAAVTIGVLLIIGRTVFNPRPGHRGDDEPEDAGGP